MWGSSAARADPFFIIGRRKTVAAPGSENRTDFAGRLSIKLSVTGVRADGLSRGRAHASERCCCKGKESGNTCVQECLYIRAYDEGYDVIT